MLWWQELDEQPDSEQLDCWACVRSYGRIWYILRGIFSTTLMGLMIWLVSRFLVVWLVEKELSFTNYIELLPVFSGVAWLVFHERWKKNETRYKNAVGDGSI